MRWILLSACTACAGLDRWSDAPPQSLVDALGARERDAVAEVIAHDAALGPFWAEEKACRMSVGPFPFFRGTAYLMHADLADLETPWNGARTWVQGDAHPMNIGAFADDSEHVVFDLNDFDESYVGDPLHDLWRLVAGADLLAEEGEHGAGAREEAAAAVVDAWLAAIVEHADGDSEAGVIDADTAYGRVDELLRDVEGRDREDLLDDQTHDGRFRLDSGRVEVDDATRDALEGALSDALGTLTSGLSGEPGWFDVKDLVAVEGSGLGSLGTPRYAVLIEGPTDDDDDDRILELTGEAAAARVNAGTRALLMDVDDHLSVLTLPDGTYTVRERSPWKASLPASATSSRTRLVKVAAQWGWVLGTAHARGDRDGGQGIAVDVEQDLLVRIPDQDAFYAESLQIGLAYAEVVRQDHAAFVDQVGCPR